MKMKRALGISVAVCTALASLTGCASKKSDTAKSSGPVQLKAIMLKHPLTKDLNKMEWLTKIEKKANVKIKWDQITADWDQKKGTLLASGDIPDLIFGPTPILDSDFSQYQGLFQDLTDLIKKDAPNIQKMFEEKPELKALATQSDGKIYGLPKYQRFWPVSSTRTFINKQWLKKLGLKTPTNWDELYNVLLAFKTKDPNGNGKADEIPMDWAPGQGYFNAMYLIGGEGITLTAGSADGFYVDNGKVKNLYNSNEYKNLVKFLNKCFKAGLVNPEVFTQDYTKYQSVARGTGKTAKVGFTWGWLSSDRFGTEVSNQYESIKQLKSSANYTGKVTYDYSFDALNYGGNMVQMSSKCANKDAAMKFVDQFYNPETSLQVLFGSVGPNISKNDDGSYTILPPKDKKMDPGTWKWTSSMADDGPMYISDSLKVTLGSDMQSIQKEDEANKSVLQSIDPKKDVFPGTFIKYSTQDNNKLALDNTNVTNLTKAKWAKWIAKGGIDAEWDAYVKNLDKAGLPEMIQIKQKYYDEYMKNNQ
ncbi:extracellular solute-binding protein [Clostridium oryzae]|uniref:Lipoprotein LipO n=1 Tax=Clostridium oryzae TaxID=1450648 RepID=A0A1V4I4Z2_9CLOT|nr:extracellular solute-binding protein [Clostridium oryzae]OPJ54665.1 lipoprotein LipO precursor [Clostridium oryzae]